MTVFHGPKEEGRVIGRVTQSCCGGCCTPKLNVLSKKGERELMVKGPCIIGDCCGVKFDVLTDKKKKVRGAMHCNALVGCLPLHKLVRPNAGLYLASVEW